MNEQFLYKYLWPKTGSTSELQFLSVKARKTTTIRSMFNVHGRELQKHNSTKPEQLNTRRLFCCVLVLYAFSKNLAQVVTHKMVCACVCLSVRVCFEMNGLLLALKLGWLLQRNAFGQESSTFSTIYMDIGKTQLLFHSSHLTQPNKTRTRTESINIFDLKAILHYLCYMNTTLSLSLEFVAYYKICVVIVTEYQRIVCVMGFSAEKACILMECYRLHRHRQSHALCNVHRIVGTVEY